MRAKQRKVSGVGSQRHAKLGKRPAKSVKEPTNKTAGAERPTK